jgi:hypothetical protein
MYNDRVLTPQRTQCVSIWLIMYREIMVVYCKSRKYIAWINSEFLVLKMAVSTFASAIGLDSVVFNQYT